MPTYEYRCESCQQTTEELQKINDAPLKVCPSCKKETLKRTFSAGAGLAFQGKGFYCTDYIKKEESSSTGSCSTHKGGCPCKK